MVEAEPMTVKQAEKVLGKKIDMSMHQDEKEGYLVTYPDGYQSFSPKSVFEEAYVCVGNEYMHVSFIAYRKDITPEMLRNEFYAWQQAMVAKYDVTFPNLKILE